MKFKPMKFGDTDIHHLPFVPRTVPSSSRGDKLCRDQIGLDGFRPRLQPDQLQRIDMIQ